MQEGLVGSCDVGWFEQSLLPGLRDSDLLAIKFVALPPAPS